MLRLKSWIVVTLLLVTPHIAFAQHGSRGSGGANGTNAGSYPRDTDSDIKDIQKMFALRATEEQKAQFQSWSQSTETMKRRLQELSAVAATNDVSSQLSALREAFEKSNGGYHDFVNGLTEAQHSGLKKVLQKLGKANDASAKALGIAIRECEHAGSDAKRAAKLANALNAIENLLNEQNRTAVEMSILS